MTTLDKLLVEVRADIKDLKSNMNNAVRVTKDSTQKIDKQSKILAAGFSKVRIAAIAASAGIVLMGKSTVTQVDKIQKLGIRLAVSPVKGYSLTYETIGIKNPPKLSIIDESIHIAITPFANRIRVAGTAEFVGFNEDIHPKRIDYLNSKLNEVYPNLYSKVKDDEEVELWFGFRPMSADGLPFIGESKIKGLYINTGHGHLGWTLAMGSAELIADQIIGEQTQIDSQPYQATR